MLLLLDVVVDVVVVECAGRGGERVRGRLQEGNAGLQLGVGVGVRRVGRGQEALRGGQGALAAGV